jgi:hypothetical protein
LKRGGTTDDDFVVDIASSRVYAVRDERFVSEGTIVGSPKVSGCAVFTFGCCFESVGTGALETSLGIALYAVRETETEGRDSAGGPGSACRIRAKELGNVHAEIEAFVDSFLTLIALSCLSSDCTGVNRSRSRSEEGAPYVEEEVKDREAYRLHPFLGL